MDNLWKSTANNCEYSMNNLVGNLLSELSPVAFPFHPMTIPTMFIVNSSSVLGIECTYPQCPQD